MPKNSASKLLIPERGVLLSCEIKDLDVPVLAFYDLEGSLKTAQLLTIQLDAGNDSWNPFIRELLLQKAVKTDDGWRIYISCVWRYGGSEGGLVMLNDQCVFSHLLLGW